MTTIHFSWTMSPDAVMTQNSFHAVMAARELGPCTIWVYEKDFDKVDPLLKKMADVQPYQALPNMKLPWSRTPKWSVEPRGDVVMGCGADSLVWNKDKLIKAAEECIAQQAVAGTIAYLEPIKASEWWQLFQDYGIPYAPCYKYQISQNPVPFYINHAAVMVPVGILQTFRESFYKYLVEINARMPNNYFMVQIALSVAIYKAKLNQLEMSRLFNYSEVAHPGMPDIEQATIVHYEHSRLKPRESPIKALRDRFKQLDEDLHEAAYSLRP